VTARDVAPAKRGRLHGMSTSMIDVKRVIEARRARLEQHAFLRSLESSARADDLRAFVPQLYFWVFAFQDMLRLAHERVIDPQLREIARRHREEDAGHQAWFAADAAELDCVRDVVWIFGDEHRVTRDVSYELVAAILEATDDRVRIVGPLVLEALGSVFFPRVVGLVDRAGLRDRLQYFARSHQQIEADHDIFTEEGAKALDGLEFDDVAFAQSVALVDRCFDQGERLATHLESARRSGIRSP
jgi:hypothetical protein